MAKIKYRFHILEVGQTMYIDADTFREKQRIRSAAWGHGALHGKEFSCCFDDGIMRVTRIS